MIASDIQGSMKEAVYETLTGILSPHYETRKAAEQRVQALEVTEDFGIHLTEFVVDRNEHLPIRQLASVLLKQYVETHWCSLAEKFRPPELNDAAKERIKELLPLGLQESISKVRTAVAYVISSIAHWDWPEKWPALFNVLITCLRDNELAIDGAMRVLTEFSRDLTEAQLPNLVPIILQEMYKIFQNENYSTGIRSCAIEIFVTITTLVANTAAYEKKFVQQYSQEFIPIFCEKFVGCLKEPHRRFSDNSFTTDIIKAINSIVKLPKYQSDFLPQMLPPIWEILCQSAKIYQEVTVNADENDEKAVDSDDEVSKFNSLIIAILELVQTILDRKKLVSLLDNKLPEIMYYLIIFMQITIDQIQQWTTSPNQFVEEDDCTYDYNVRISAQEFLTALILHFEEKAVHVLCDVVTRHIEATKALQPSGDGSGRNEGWWKLRESSLLALSLSKNIVVEKQQAGTLQFDIVRFLDTVVLGMLNDPGDQP